MSSLPLNPLLHPTTSPTLNILLLLLALSTIPTLVTSKIGSDFPTRPNGLYCSVGKGMRRQISQLMDNPGDFESENIEVSYKAVQFCVDATFCFELKTNSKEKMISTFGEGLGDVKWDEYYDEFYVLGCGEMYGTQSYTKEQKCLHNKAGQKLAGGKGVWQVRQQIEYIPPDDLIVDPLLADLNITGEEEGGVELPSYDFDLSYCCYDNFCSGSLGGANIAIGTIFVVFILGIGLVM